MNTLVQRKARATGREQILIIEDDPVASESLSHQLTAAGFSTLTAHNGLNALDMLYERRPALVVSDWMMPKMDGLEFCRTVKEIKREYFVYFIMLTIRTDTEDVRKAFAGGVDDFISKPCDGKELLARVGVGMRLALMCNELTAKVQRADKLNVDLSSVNTSLSRMAMTDALTGLKNRRQAVSKLTDMWNLATRYSRGFSCAMIDIDHFKMINDTYGHPAGDEVLKALSSILTDAVRETDSVYRMGGEEFLIILPGTDVEEATQFAERCRHLVSSQPLRAAEHDVRLTTSIGVTAYSSQMSGPGDLLRQVDKRLYEAKKQGRNRVVADSHRVSMPGQDTAASFSLQYGQ